MMKLTLKRLSLAIASVGILTIYGCGGGGDGGVSSAAVTATPALATSLTGTAAIGAPISGSVFAIDINGKISPAATTSALGAFIVNVDGMTAPFILSVTGTAGGKLVSLNSIATAAGQTVNITPLTDLIVSTASGRPGGSSLTELCAPVSNVVPTDCLTALTSAADSTKLASATQAVIEMIAPLNTTGINPLRDAFVANGTGMDAVLDQILVAPADTQGATATITLVATGNTIGTSILPATAGGTSTTTTTAPSESELIKATAAATVLPEIRACLASFNALYPKTGFTAPSTEAVTPFVYSTFKLGQGEDQQALISALTDPNELAFAGLSLEAVGFSPFDMSPLTTEEITTLTTSTSTTRAADFIATRRAAGKTSITFTVNLPTSAWIQLRFAGDSSLSNWKMLKGAAYDGCAGGWKLAGSGHLDMHMNARITRNTDTNGSTTFGRKWAFHIEQANVLAENSTVNRIDVRGPGLTDFGDYSANNTTGKKLQLMMPNANYTAMRFANSDSPITGNVYYGNAEALESCQDLASISPKPGNLTDVTPCIDESKVAPGKVYVWTLKASETPVSSFPFEISAVPLSKAFVQANQNSLFATLTGVTPSTLSGLNALTGTLLNGLVTFNYNQSSTYGSKMDNCGLYLWNGNTLVLNAEHNAMGKETSCTFTTDGLNSIASNAGGAFQFTGTLSSAYIGMSTSVLGNQASSGQPLPN
jgi:hypothetical protein